MWISSLDMPRGRNRKENSDVLWFLLSQGSWDVVLFKVRDKRALRTASLLPTALTLQMPMG